MLLLLLLSQPDVRTLSTNIMSSRLLVIIPMASAVYDIGTMPFKVYLPEVGLYPYAPHRAAGMRHDPKVSTPIPILAIPVATAPAAPPLFPPAINFLSTGFLTGPK